MKSISHTFTLDQFYCHVEIPDWKNWSKPIESVTTGKTKIASFRHDNRIEKVVDPSNLVGQMTGISR